MAPAARRDRAETFLGRKSRFSPLSDTAPLSTFVIMVGVTCFQLTLGVIKEAMGRVLSALCVAEVDDPPCQGVPRAEERVSRGSLIHYLTFHTILLCGEE